MSKEHDMDEEFATVDAVLNSGATTKRTDAFVLAWVKMEKQLRRLFSFLVFQNPSFTSKDHEQALVKIFVNNTNLYSGTFIKCIDALGSNSVENLVGNNFSTLIQDIARMKKYRNKIMHGQITGQNLQSPQIEKDIQLLRQWIRALAVGAQNTFGYDGIGRNTFIKAHQIPAISNIQYPFNSISEFEAWLKKTAV